ncbi:MAG: SsgA family sporulation/cell division regulator [Actinomycetota bacterium]|nr:SsgA family sporulation/cell division regulator [Actinomycetota bacterium]
MSEPLRSIVCPTVAEIVSTSDTFLPVDCELRYDVSDGFAVTAIFSTMSQTVSWTFARSLLDEGRHRPTGEGDIFVRPDLDEHGHAAVSVELRSPDGTAVLRAPTADVTRFLDMTKHLVPDGGEMADVDIDSVIERLLLGAG